MPVIEDKNKETASAEDPSIPSAAVGAPKLKAESAKELDAAVECALEQQLKERPQSVGEKIYNRSVYTGIGFGLNEVVSLLFTGMFERGKNRFLGRERFEQASNWMVKTFHMKDKMRNGLPVLNIEGQPITAKLSANSHLMFISLNVIGCFVVPAIKIIDNYKSGIVKWLNHRFDSSGKSAAEIAARDKDVEEAVACESAQSWKTLIYGRLISMVASIGIVGVGMGEAGSAKLKNWFGGGATWAAKKTGMGKLAAGNPKLPGHELSPFHYYTRLAGPETAGCATTSVVLEIASKFFAKRWPTFKNPKLRAEIKEREKMELAAALAEHTASAQDETGATPRGIRALAVAKPSASYVEKVSAEPQPTLQAGV